MLVCAKVGRIAISVGIIKMIERVLDYHLGLIAKIDGEIVPEPFRSQILEQFDKLNVADDIKREAEKALNEIRKKYEKSKMGATN